MIKKIITDISEEDFRKLDITVYKHEWVDNPNQKWKTLSYVPYKINKLLDEEIVYALESGYPEDLEHLKIPVTVAIHEDNFGNTDGKEGLHGYFDKFMNQYSGITTYYIAFGIKHLYSTRDYYEDHEDYWRVRKDETKVIYRVQLDKKWIDKFVLKHETKIIKWPYEMPEKCDEAYLEIRYDIVDDKHVETGRTGIFKFGKRTDYIPVDEFGNRIPPAYESK